jgi:hypothetical protein
MPDDDYALTVSTEDREGVPYTRIMLRVGGTYDATLIRSDQLNGLTFACCLYQVSHSMRKLLMGREKA